MGNISKIRGQAGELDCASEFMSEVAGRGVLFHPVALAENEPTADHLVFLLSPTGELSGPFFFVQVKSTSKGPRADGSYTYSFSAQDVQRAHAMKVPFLLCLVDRSIPNERRIFIKGVDSKRKRGIYRISTKYDLRTDAVKIALHREVTRAGHCKTNFALGFFYEECSPKAT